MTRQRAIVIGSLVFLLLLGTPASGQAAGSVELVAQSSWVDDGGIYDLQVRVAGADPESSVVVQVFPAWSERDDFLRQELPTDTEPLLELEPVVLGEAQNTSNEVLGFQVAVAGPDTPIEDEGEEGTSSIQVLATDGGSAVFPVEVSLYDADGVLSDRFLTSLIELPRTQRAAPLQVAIALETRVLPAMQPDGSIAIPEEQLAEIETLVDAIAQHPSASVALSISPETLAGLDALSSAESDRILEKLVDIDSSQLFANPYTEVQEQAWVQVGLTPELRELYLTGASITNTILGTAPDPSVMLLDRTIDDEGLAALTNSISSEYDAFGVEAVIVRPAQLEGLNRELFPQALTTRFVVPTDDGTTIPALVADGGLANHFTNEGGPTFNANRLLADLTLLSLQNSDVRQAVVVNPPVDWVPDATFLNVMLTGLERIPAIRGVSPVDALAETAFTPERGIDTLSPPLRRALEPQRDPLDLRSFRTEFSQAQTAIRSWSEVITGDQASNDRLTSLLRLSTDYRLSEEQRSEYIDTIYSLIETQKESSITTPASETITLTGRLADVPITLNNDLGVDANVLLVLDAEKLSFPDGQALSITLRPGANRIEVPIEARASGDSPIRVQVFTPDRSVLLGSSEVLVRTLAFSGVGIVIGVVSLIVLLLWWLRHARSTRATVPPETSAPTDATRDGADRNTEHIGV